MNATVPYELGLVWLRRDLRLDDNTALHLALGACHRVQLVFVYDKAILNALPAHDRRMPFIDQSVQELHTQIQERTRCGETGLIAVHDWPEAALPALAQQLGANAVFANHDDDPYALQRDAAVRDALATIGVAWHSSKDHTVFERRELLTADGQPYRVYTPYQRKWQQSLRAYDVAERDCAALATRCHRTNHPAAPPPTLKQIGFGVALAGAPAHLSGGRTAGLALLRDFCTRMDEYGARRDFPGLRGPSYLGVHLRFGTLSVRELLRAAQPRADRGSEGARVWMNQLVWRDFFAQILANFPHVAHGCFRREYDDLAWEVGSAAQMRFDAWCVGQTGYPLVDAAMRQLVQTGYMHNRLRMVAASFLVKHLGVDWRRGEAYFAQQLLDFDLANNNGGWQWASSTGCDAQPYFRIFNPVAQSRKFDPQARFILRYVPELNHAGVRDPHAPWESWSDPAELTRVTGYPNRVVALDAGRARTLLRFGAIASRPPRSNHAPD